MESGPGPSSLSQSFSDIPREIYQPLLEMAQRGYDVNDVKTWYGTLLRHLRRMGAENAEVAYRMGTPASDCSSTLPIQSNRRAPEDYPSSRRTTLGSVHSHVSPKTQPAAWPVSQAPEMLSETQAQDFAIQNQLQISASPQQVYTLSDQIQPSAPQQQSYVASADFSQAPFMSATYSPSQMMGAENLPFGYGTSTSEAVAFTGEAATANQWFSPDDFNMVNDTPMRRHTSPTPPYQMEMSNTQMPVLVPSYQPSPPASLISANTDPASFNGINQYSFPPTNTLSTPMFYTPVTILPSRKRRKLLQKGVKKMMQPLQNQQKQPMATSSSA